MRIVQKILIDEGYCRFAFFLDRDRIVHKVLGAGTSVAYRRHHGIHPFHPLFNFMSAFCEMSNCPNSNSENVALSKLGGILFFARRSKSGAPPVYNY